HRNVPASKISHLDRLEEPKRGPVVLFVPESLQNLRAYEVAGKDKLLAQQPVEHVRLFRDPPVEIVDPDGAIGENHGPAACLPCGRLQAGSSLLKRRNLILKPGEVALPLCVI